MQSSLLPTPFISQSPKKLVTDHQRNQPINRACKNSRMKEELSSSSFSLIATSIASLLPDQVLYEIFRHIPMPKLTNLELVCKHWKTIIRYHQSLWKESFLQNHIPYEQKDFCAVHSFEMVTKLMQRNQGKLSNIFLPFSLKHLAFMEIEDSLNALASSEVQHLWIVVGTELPCCYNHQCKRHGWIAVPYKKMVKMVIKAITQCSNLKSLRFVSTKDVQIFTSKPKKAPEWQISTCKLEKLSLIGINLGSFFIDESMYSILSTIRTMDIAFGSNCNDGDELAEAKRILRALEEAKDTLEECRLYCSFHHLDKVAEDHVLLREPKGSLCFPNLKKLSLNFNRGFSHLWWFDYANVEYLNLRGMSDPTMALKVPRTKRLTTLQVKVPAQTAEFAKCVEQYRFLRHLFLRFSIRSKGPVFLCEIKHTLKNLPLEELTVQGTLEHEGDELIDLVRARKNDEESTKIKAINVVRCKTINAANTRWLNENLDQFQAFEWKISNGMNSINYEYEGVHFFELESTRLRAMLDPTSKRYS